MTFIPLIALCLLASPVETVASANSDAPGIQVARAKKKRGKKKKKKKKAKPPKVEAEPEVMELDLNAPEEPEPEPEPPPPEPEEAIELGDVDVEGGEPPATAVEQVYIEDTVLVMDLRPVDFTNAEAEVVTTVVAELIAARPGIRVVTPADVQVMAKQAQPPRPLSCAGDDCMKVMAEVSQATLALTGFVGRVDQQFIVSVKTFDMETGEAGGSGTRRVPTVESIFHTLPGLLAEVYGWADDGAVTEDRYILGETSEKLFAVVDLRPQGMDRETADRVARLLGSELNEMDDIKVMGREHIAKLAGGEVATIRARCPDENRCLGEIGLALEVDKVVAGTIGKLGSGYLISLRLIDVRTLRIENRMYESVAGLEEELAPAMSVAVRRLLGRLDESSPGALILSSNVRAIVTLDEEVKGPAPMLLHGLAPGRHTLHLSFQGYVDWTSDVYVEPGKSKPLTIELAAVEVPPEWYEQWWIWVSLSAAVVAGASVGVAFYIDSATKLPVTTGGMHEL